jgi:hypothetical protein
MLPRRQTRSGIQPGGSAIGLHFRFRPAPARFPPHIIRISLFELENLISKFPLAKKILHMVPRVVVPPNLSRLLDPLPSAFDQPDANGQTRGALTMRWNEKPPACHAQVAVELDSEVDYLNAKMVVHYDAVIRLTGRATPERSVVNGVPHCKFVAAVNSTRG